MSDTETLDICPECNLYRDVCWCSDEEQEDE